MSKTVEIKVLTKDAEEAAFPHIDTNNFAESDITHVAILEGGMQSGRTSVCLCIPMGQDGRHGHVLVQMSAAQFENIAGAVRGAAGRFGEEL